MQSETTLQVKVNFGLKALSYARLREIALGLDENFSSAELSTYKSVIAKAFQFNVLQIGQFNNPYYLLIEDKLYGKIELDIRTCNQYALTELARYYLNRLISRESEEDKLHSFHYLERLVKLRTPVSKDDVLNALSENKNITKGQFRQLLNNCKDFQNLLLDPVRFWNWFGNCPQADLENFPLAERQMTELKKGIENIFNVYPHDYKQEA